MFSFLRRRGAAEGSRTVIASCSHLDSIRFTEPPRQHRWLRGVPSKRRLVGAPAHVPVLRAHRLLRRLA